MPAARVDRLDSEEYEFLNRIYFDEFEDNLKDGKLRKDGPYLLATSQNLTIALAGLREIAPYYPMNASSEPCKQQNSSVK